METPISNTDEDIVYFHTQLNIIIGAVDELNKIAHALHYELDKHRKAITNHYTYLQGQERELANMKQRVEMLELRLAKDNEGGHA